MDIREATTEDREGIRRVAEASLAASYADSLGESVVEEAATEWYDGSRLGERLGADGVLYLVGVEDGDVVAFSESAIEDAAAAIEWLHVHPDHRGHGVGAELLERTETTLLERGANRIEGRVLAANDSGNEFYQEHGYVRTGDRGLDVAGTTQTEHLYVKMPEGDDPMLTEQRETEEGTMWIAFDERERGSLAPFYAAYTSADRGEKYGFYCANCESVDTAMDSMGRVTCGSCGNERKATRWDAAYL